MLLHPYLKKIVQWEKPDDKDTIVQLGEINKKSIMQWRKELINDKIYFQLGG